MKANPDVPSFTHNFSNHQASRKHVRAALILAILLVTVVGFTLPYSRYAGISIQAFLPAFISAVAICELITMYLVFSEFQVNRSPALAVLASAYLFTGLITIPHILTFPGVFSETGLLHAGNQTAVWLWVFWHGGYPSFIFLYTLINRKYGEHQVTHLQARRILLSAVCGTIAIVTILTLIAIYGNSWLPKIIQKDNYRVLITSGIGPIVWTLNLLALLSMQFIVRKKSVVHIWLTLAVLASLLDVTLTLFSGSRYSIGWYVARLNSILSAGTLLVVFLYEIRFLYYRVVQQERIFRTVFEFAAVGIARIDLSQKPIESNHAFQQMLGYEEEELQKTPLSGITHPEDVLLDERLMDELVYGQRKNFQVEKRYLHKNGGMVWGNSIVSLVRGVNDEPEFFIGMVEDITKRKQYEEQIHFQAYHDALTGLPNRVLFADRLNLSVLQAARNPKKIGVMFLDLDGFKQVNDTLGHNIGDLLLKQVSERLVASMREGDTVARMGGDEFTMILPDLQDVNDARVLAERVLNVVKQPYVLEGHHVTVTTSIGISLYPYHGEDGQTLMKLADMAMYKAKESGKNQYAIYA
ncbi:sensor domain-containing diguanylate cyclase [Paenibacillus hexagrammi]|uniref:Diguanylate cyclase n=1 Tax=Paenibacillus hexagrammi TaxID=2908839 RepID=A0ABY3SD89_9BACL|nr:sensor domain-containing diguanylate cyclase [Paenibacillus sp. YPD9-1]UJF31901.1 diguanylate cyclase [Paenibacillus sp. YPD9-1]